MPLLGLQTVDRQDHGAGVAISVLQDMQILMPSRDQVLVRGQVIFEGIVGQWEVIAIAQLVTNLRHGPMPGKTSLTDPAKDVPADTPTWHGILLFLLGTEEFPLLAAFLTALHELDI